MSLKQNIIYLYFKGKHLITSKSQYQYNHGQYLYFADLNLPQAFEVHFSNKQRGESKTQIGSNRLVEIPDEYFWSGALQIYAWVYLHSGTDDGETIYEVKIPLIKRAKPTDEETLPVQQSAIDKAIAELNNAVDITNENADKTNADKTQVATIKEEVVTLKEEIDSSASAVSQDAQSARESADASEQSAQNSAESERKALDYSDEAKGYAQSALESKNTASQKAQVASDASAEAKDFRDEAETFKNEAEQAKQNIVDYRNETKGYRDEALTAKDDVQTIKGDVQLLKTQIDDTADNVFENAREAYQSMISADNASLSASESAENASQSAINASESANQAEEFKNQSATNVAHYPKVVDGYWYVWDANNNEYINTNVDARGVKGDKGDVGNGIENTVLNSDYTLTITFTDGTSYTTPSIRGEKGIKGDVGNGIASTVLNDDYTLTLTFTDGTTYKTPSIRGEKGEQGEPATDMDIHICSASEYDSETRIPTITSPDDKTFYLVPTEDGTSPDLFTEWVYVNNAWEMFGSASVDLTDYVKNTDYASANTGGVVKVDVFTNDYQGGIATIDNKLNIIGSSATDIKSGLYYNKPVVVGNQHESTFYGLAKVAGHDEKNSTLPVGQYTDEAKSSIQDMLGITDKYSPKEWIAESETELVTNAHGKGDLFYIGETLYKVIADLNAGDVVNVGVNVEEVDVDDILDDYATKEDIQDNVSIVEKSASGSVASFDDGMNDMPLKELVVNIEPVQDLHGYDSPWVGGSGKNIVDVNNPTYTGTNISVTDGTIKSEQPSGAGSNRYISYTVEGLTVGTTYYLSVYVLTNTTGDRIKLSLQSGGTGSAQTGYGGTGYIGFAFEATETSAVFRITQTSNGSWTADKLQLEVGSSRTDYIPYENICPISGWTGMEIQHTGENLFDQNEYLLADATKVEDAEYPDTYTGNKYRFYHLHGDASDNPSATGLIPMKPYGQLTISYYKYYTPSDRIYFHYTDAEAWVNHTGNITTEGYKSYTSVPNRICDGVALDTSQGSTATFKIGALQIKVESEATEYEPYYGDIILTSWSDDVGTVYGGYVDLVKGELVVDWVHVLFSRSSRVIDSGTSDDGLRKWMTLRIAHNVPPYQITPNNGDDYGMFSIGNWRHSVEAGKNRAYVNSTYVYAVITTDIEDLTTAEGRTAYFDRLETNNIPIEVVYKRATPLHYQLTPQQLLTLKGTNNIWSDTNGQTEVKFWTH